MAGRFPSCHRAKAVSCVSMCVFVCGIEVKKCDAKRNVCESWVYAYTVSTGYKCPLAPVWKLRQAIIATFFMNWGLKWRRQFRKPHADVFLVFKRSDMFPLPLSHQGLHWAAVAAPQPPALGSTTGPRPVRPGVQGRRQRRAVSRCAGALHFSQATLL